MSFKSEHMAQAIVIREMILDTGVNPLSVYCQITGAPIGTLNHAEWRLIWDSLDGTCDREEIIDELYSRTIACMRPSPAWNYIRPGTLNRLRLADPIRTCAYLLGRYFEPHDPSYSRIKRRYEDRIADGITRIQTFEKLAAFNGDITVLREFTLHLLMLDSQFDLSILDYIPDFPNTPQELNLDILKDYIPTLASFYELLILKKLKLEKTAKLESTWLASGGNRLTRDTATKAFLEVKPESEATKQRKAKEAAATAMADVLKSLMDQDSPANQTTGLPKAAPAGVKVGGFRFNLARVGG